MRASVKEKKLSKFEKLNSASSKNPIWPNVRLDFGRARTYVRVKRHNVYFLVYVVKFAEGSLPDVMAVFQQVHYDAFNVYRFVKIDLNTPYLSGNLDNVPSAYVDDIQKPED